MPPGRANENANDTRPPRWALPDGQPAEAAGSV